MRSRSRTLASLTAALALAAVTVGAIGSPVGAGTTQLGPIEGVCVFPDLTFENEFDLTVTLTVPDQVETGAAFDADIKVEIDLPPAQINVYDFELVSHWDVGVGASPSGPVTVTTPGRDYVTGDPIVYDTVTVPFVATGAAGETVSFELTGMSYQFDITSGGTQLTTDCVWDGLPVVVDSFPIVAGPLTCLGQPVTIAGTTGDDLLVGTNGPDVIHTVDGDNVVFGLGGDDIICGGPGNDVIFGGPGNDTIDGGGGFNLLFGGRGSNSCTNGFAFGC